MFETEIDRENYNSVYVAGDQIENCLREFTYYPYAWSHEKIAKEVLNVFHDKSSRIESYDNQMHLITGVTKDGVKIEVMYNDKNQTIESARPLLRKS